MKFRFLLHALAVFSLSCCLSCRKSAPPYAVNDALKTFRIEPGFHIEKFVLEPVVVSPVAMDFDENGRIYVVEDRGYPLSTDNPLGRVKLLEDTNGDGVPDKVTIFVDRLVMPTGVMRWKKGILVTDAPNVWYFEDTNGDGVADVKQIVLTGFAFTNPQHTVNNPSYGLDNWIYLANEGPARAIVYKKQFGDLGSDIRFPDWPQSPALKQHDRSVRFRPDTHQLEALSGRSQYGQAFDDWGHYFTVNNSDHSREEIIAARYLERNPDLPISSAMQQISDHEAAAKVYPITVHPHFEMLTDVGQFTSACGITFYHGTLFVAEPVHNLVHQDLLSASGATYVSRRAHPNVEFLASTDPWFRPVNFKIGPDGAMYLMDFYRMMIEHPEWMATDAAKSPDLTKGIDRGRIYRIVPDGIAPARAVKLGSASNPELVRELDNPNIWWRRTAQRLLVDRQAADVTAELARMAAQGQSATGRLHALWTLEGLGKLENSNIQRALTDVEPGVRENGIILAEPRLAKSPELAQKLLGMVDDTNARVRFQLLCTLAGLTTAEARTARDRLLVHEMEDKWFQVAALSASSDEAPRLYQTAVSSGKAETPGSVSFIRQVASVVGARRKPAEIQNVVQRIARSTEDSASWWRTASLEGLSQGLRGRAFAPGSLRASQQTLLKIFSGPEITVRRAALRLLGITGLAAGGERELASALSAVSDDQTDPDLRADSIGLLALAGPQPHEGLLKKLVDPHQPAQVEAAAVDALGKIKGDDVGKFLLAAWRALPPDARMEAADAMFLEPSRVRLLVAALKSGDVQPWTLGFRHRHRLIMFDDPAIRDSVRPVLDQSTSDREKVVRRYEAGIDHNPDATKGREVFKTVCIKCHRFAGFGVQVGPDLATVQNQPKTALLEDILIPNKTISQGYEAYVVETTSGTLDGVLHAQTPTTITLRHEDGKEDIIQRRDIKQMYVTNVSAMPGDMEKQIDVQQMADLLEFLKTAH